MFSLVQRGHDDPDTSLRRLQLLAQETSAAPEGPALAARKRWLLLGQGLVLAGAGRSTDTWTVASTLRAQAADSLPVAGTLPSRANTATGPAADTPPAAVQNLDAALGAADALLVQAVLADTQGQTQQARTLAQAALDAYSQLCPAPGRQHPARAAEPAACDHRTVWRALHVLARHVSMQGQNSAARDHALAAAELARAAGDAGHQAWALAQAADLSTSLGESDLAQRQFAQARRLARLQGAPHTRLRLAIYDTRMRSRSGDMAGARRAAQAGLLLAEQADSPRLRAVLLANLSDIHVKTGQPQAALDAVQQALPIVRRHGELRIERVLLANAGLARIGLGQRDAARHTLDELLAAFAAAGADADRATVLREFADALAESGDLKAALELYHRERQLAVELTSANRQAAMAELQQRYDSSAQQRRLEQLASANRLYDTQLANRQTQQWLWALGVVVLVLAGVLVTLMYRRVREVNRQLTHSHASLRVQSQRDPLTGLANRRCLHEQAQHTGAVQGALLLVDIDHFKRINDSQGHASGDAVLVDVARRLAAAVRPEDLVVRWGGEEFLVYAPHLAAEATRALAARLLQAVGGQPVRLPGEGPAAPGIEVTASVGFACFPLAPQGLPLPLDRAINLIDMALYTAKNQGRNRAVGLARVRADDEHGLRAVEDDFDSAWREGRVVLDLLPGPARVQAGGDAAEGADGADGADGANGTGTRPAPGQPAERSSDPAGAAVAGPAPAAAPSP